MLKYCRDKWYENKDKLEVAIRESKNLKYCGYETLVEMVIKYILNPSSKYQFDEESITVIDNGDYQGTILFMIPLKTYQPNAGNYILTYIYYGSCDVCDTLQSIQYDEELSEEEKIKEFMALCKDLVCNIVKPYNNGWFEDENFVEIAS